MSIPPPRSIPPIGQNDWSSCWAACLSWWLTANGRPRSTQNDLLVEFDSLTEEDGTITLDTMIRIMKTPRFNAQSYKADINNIQDIRDNGVLPITNLPNLLCFKRFIVGPGIIGMHANAIFDQRGDDGHKIVTCMEPDFPEGASNNKRIGGFVDRDIGDFLKSAPILLVCSN
jgi:hypothetical protein